MQQQDQNVFKFVNKDENQSILKRSQNIKINQKSSGGNVLSSFCINQKCQNNHKFLCHNAKCQCQQKHFECQKGNFNVVLENIEKKINQNINKIKLQITQIFNNFIDKISEFQQHVVKQVDQKLQFNQLVDMQKNFYEIFNNQKIQNLLQFDSLKLLTLLQFFNKNKSIKLSQKYFSNYLQQIKIFQSQNLSIMQKTKKSINIFSMIQIKENKNKPLEYRNRQEQNKCIYNSQNIHQQQSQQIINNL